MIFSLLNNEITEEDYLKINNICVIYKKMPKKIYGFIHRYKDINIIIINWNISKERKKRTLLHEFAHLELNHLDSNNPLFAFYIENAEDEADAYLDLLEDYVERYQGQIKQIYDEYEIKMF